MNLLEWFQTILLLVILTVVATRLKPHKALPTKAGRTRKLILDTCALIDGRILELSRSGFVPDELIVPEFVLHELQMLADGPDAHKRERARFGLEVVQILQEGESYEVTIDNSEYERIPNDDKLVELALKKKSPLYTTDFNLQKLAEIKGVRVLNVNELAQNLRPSALPGERKTIKILQKGSNPKQGVGYLDDGTMVVVDGAAKLIGKTVELEVTRVHQTVAGKMLFGEIIPPTQSHNRSTPVQTTPTKVESVATRLRYPRRGARKPAPPVV